MTEACVGLGSNLDLPARQVVAAAARLAGWPGVSDLRCSRLYRTPPWGDADQPAFINAVAAFDYAGSPDSLLVALLAIEREAGRVRGGRRWGPRVLDLDLLLFGDEHIDSPTLSVPHPRLRDRAFVLLPMADVAPDLRLPDGTAVADAAAACDRSGIEVLESAQAAA
jgi:2-amino-4-hydroxy-6-hydroxymethyldihydropteridine diphosphokinase